jgi:EAL domain-containing protein (putative c-di-GMP-specific phosphodiesterase class I)
VVVERVESTQDAQLAMTAGADWLQGIGMARPGERHNCVVQADPDVQEGSGYEVNTAMPNEVMETLDGRGRVDGRPMI